MTAIPDGYEQSVCRFGGRETTCAFLAMGDGFFCAKGMPHVAEVIRGRLADGTMGAKGDNCSGPPDFEVPQ